MIFQCTVDAIEHGSHFHHKPKCNRIVIKIKTNDALDHVHVRVIDDGTYKLGDTFQLVSRPCSPEPEPTF